MPFFYLYIALPLAIGLFIAGIAVFLGSKKAAAVVIIICSAATIGCLYFLLENGNDPEPPSVESSFSWMVDTTPGGAAIFVDGRHVGTGGETIKLTAGEHRFRLELSGYETHERQVFVSSDSAVSFRLKLIEPGEEKPTSYQWTFDSTPSGATIVVDDVQIGKTKKTVKIPRGEYRIRLELAGFEPYDRVIQVDGNSGISHQFMGNRESISYSWMVMTTPSRAMIIVDGEQVGMSRETIRLTAGEHRLRLELADYETFDRQISVFSDSTIYHRFKR